MRPLVFLLSLAALLLVVLQVSSGVLAYNDSDDHGSSGTHYMQCTYGDHARWPYTDYSEQNFSIVSRFWGFVPLAYQDLFLYAAVNWNAQGTRVSHTPGSLGPNIWASYSQDDGFGGRTFVFCSNTSTGEAPDLATQSWVFLNRFNLDGSPVSVARHVTLHELGHQITLGHSDRFVEYPVAVMWPSVTSVLYSMPQPDDVCGVNAIYRSNTYPVTGTCHSDHSLPPP